MANGAQKLGEKKVACIPSSLIASLSSDLRSPSSKGGGALWEISVFSADILQVFECPGPAEFETNTRDCGKMRWGKEVAAVRWKAVGDHALLFSRRRGDNCGVGKARDGLCQNLYLCGRVDSVACTKFEKRTRETFATHGERSSLYQRIQLVEWAAGNWTCMIRIRHRKLSMRATGMQTTGVIPISKWRTR